MRSKSRLGVLHVLLFFLVHIAAGEETADIGIDGTVNAAAQPTPPPTSMQAQVQKLTAQALAGETPAQQRETLWRRILELDPRNSNAFLQLGLLTLGLPDRKRQEQAIDSIARAFDAKYVDNPIPMPSSAGLRLAMLVGRFRWEQQDYMQAYYYFQLAMRATRLMANEGTAQTCVAVSLATMLHPFPNSVEHADKMYHHYLTSARRFLEAHQRDEGRPNFDQAELAASVPGAAEDPYVHCVLTIFQLSFYYRADVAEAARLHYQVATSVWPELKYVSPSVVRPTTPPHLDTHKPCITRKIQLGVASGFLTPGSSVSEDFKGVMQRLDRSIFNVTYIHFQNNATSETDPFVFRHPQLDRLLVFTRQPQHGDVGKAAWMARFYPAIEALNLDVLLYLDLTMSPFATRMSMARLAPVQAVSHGHPVTSGVEAVDYFISWGAAELDHETANAHYSEELVLLNPKVPHQYYVPRNHNGLSMIDGMSYSDKAHRSFFRMFMPSKGPWGDAIFDENDSNTIRWYTCMQKPHKFMPEMDPLLCNVLRDDPDGILLLHQPDISAKMQQAFEKRLRVAGCDMDRIYFIPALPHHMLLALYQASTLILDSYPAGGCTTTREALELSKVVVTLPARLLGGRWSYAYYQMLDDAILNEHVIADSPEDYVQKAVRLGREAPLREDMENRIRDSIRNLYGSQDAVRSWEHALLTISPVEKRDQCEIENEG